MFWKKDVNNRYEYVAITKLSPIREDKALYGQRHFRVTLSDGTSEEVTFEADDWEKFHASYRNGGFVLNA